MTEDNGLSRRRLLGSIATVGGAAALGGAGSVAFFSDREAFANNRLVAGELDLKVDWEEHYFDWSDDEAEFAEMAVDPAAADYLLPAPTDLPGAEPIALNFVGEDGRDRLWDASSIEAYPDADDDGIQDQTDDGVPVFPEADSICDAQADTPEVLSSELRTEGTVGEEPNPQTTEPGDPLVAIQDVKPGDFGELTLSFHLCGNPGYVWLTGALRGATESDLAEPERKDDQEDGDGDSTDPTEVELLDAIQTRFWYDDGDNQLELGGDVDLMVAVDRSISIDEMEAGQVADAVDDLTTGLANSVSTMGDVDTGVVTFGDDQVRVNKVPSPGLAGVEGPDEAGSGNTPLPAAIDIADQVLTDFGRPDAEDVIVLFTDGGPNYRNTVYSDTVSGTVYEAPRDPSFSADPADQAYDNEGSGGPGAGGVTQAEFDETALVADKVKAGGTRIVVVALIDAVDDPGFDTRSFLETRVASSSGDYLEVGFDDISGVADTIAAATMNEEVFLRGSLRETLSTLAGDTGVPLDADRSTPFGETDDPPTAETRECHPPSTTAYVGFEWWLPVDHANEIQTDGVQFDLGFYTEQCRHNDGEGIGNT